VSPDGERYLLEEVAGGDWLTIADWSPDRRSVLQRDALSLNLVDLVTRESTVVVDGGVAGATFTRPTGRNLIVQAVDNGQVQWRSRTGELLGILVERTGPSWEYSEWIYGEDGTHLVIGVEDALLHLTADGRLIGELAVPDAALDGTACHPRKWWPDGRVLAACVVETGVNATADALYLIPLDGGPPERISPEPSLNPQRGYADAWPFEGGVLLQWATYGDGGGQEITHPDGTLEELGWDLPNRPGADHVVEVGPDRVVVLNRGGTGPGTTGALVAVTPSTGEVRVLVPGNPEEGGVLSVIVPGNPGIGARAPA
jgi:hypothetical protein